VICGRQVRVDPQRLDIVDSLRLFQLSTQIGWKTRGGLKCLNETNTLTKLKRDNKAKDEIEMMKWESRVQISPW